jgi:hypothetical protein
MLLSPPRNMNTIELMRRLASNICLKCGWGTVLIDLHYHCENPQCVAWMAEYTAGAKRRAVASLRRP